MFAEKVYGNFEGGLHFHQNDLLQYVIKNFDIKAIGKILNLHIFTSLNYLISVSSKILIIPVKFKLIKNITT